jgi:Alcohol dehydrogenase GroES-associated
MEAVVYDGPRTVSVKEVPDARVDNLIMSSIRWDASVKHVP